MQEQKIITLRQLYCRVMRTAPLPAKQAERMRRKILARLCAARRPKPNGEEK